MSLYMYAQMYPSFLLESVLQHQHDQKIIPILINACTSKHGNSRCLPVYIENTVPVDLVDLGQLDHLRGT